MLLPENTLIISWPCQKLYKILVLQIGLMTGLLLVLGFNSL